MRISGAVHEILCVVCNIAVTVLCGAMCACWGVMISVGVSGELL